MQRERLRWMSEGMVNDFFSTIVPCYCWGLQTMHKVYGRNPLRPAVRTYILKTNGGPMDEPSLCHTQEEAKITSTEEMVTLQP